MAVLAELSTKVHAPINTFQCRICRHIAEPILSFGRMPLANAFLIPEDFSREVFFDLKVTFCPSCSMVQLLEQPEPEKMFHHEYPFFTSSSLYMQSHLAELADFCRERYLSGKDPFVVEIGSNDGTLLKNFQEAGMHHLGIEPSLNVGRHAIDKGVQTMASFFNEETAIEIVKKNGQADLCLATNVMCHIPDLQSVARGLEHLLKPRGVFVFEDPYIGDILDKTSYDQIYDEHVYYFSLKSLQFLFSQHNMEIIDVKAQKTHGGSMRYVVARKDVFEVKESVKALMGVESAKRMEEKETYLAFAKRCESSKEKLRDLLSELRGQGKRVIGYAATSKSTTVLNYCELGTEDLEFISDTTLLKQGKVSPGKHIPVKSERDFRNDYPDYALLFGWNHQEEIMEKEQSFTDQGGKWIVYVPEVKIL